MRWLRTAVGTAAVVVAVAAGQAAIVGTDQPSGAGRQPGISPDQAGKVLAELPLAFEANLGQSDPRVRFLARAPGMGVFLTPSEAVLSLRPSGEAQSGAAVRLVPVGADPRSDAVGLDPLPGRVNHLVGDAAARHTNVATYAKVAQRGVYPGIDLVYYGKGGLLEYDVVVAPGADPDNVRLAVEGATGLRLDAGRDLVVDTAAGPLIHRRPVAYQQLGAERRPVAADYVLRGAEVGLVVGPYDHSRPLVIDPVLAYSTFLGGTGLDEGLSIAVDGAGAAYVTGKTASTDFPTTAGAFDTSANGFDAFVSKVNPTGSGLAYSTYLGGTGSDDAVAIAVDGSGAAYVTGGTESTDFPTTAGAFDTTFSRAFVAKLNPAGSELAYSTYLGGSGYAEGTDIAVDASGSAYVTGQTGSPDFPTTPGAFDTTYAGGHAYDVFVTKLGPAGSSLVYSTLLGGVGVGEEGGQEWATGIAIDGAGAAYVTGYTDSADFPTTPGAFDRTEGGIASDAFVAKLDPAGSGLVYSTYLGGASSADWGFGIAVDSTGAAFVAGGTGLSGFNPVGDFPTTPGAFDPTFTGSDQGFVTKLTPTGSALTYSTFLGSSAGRDIALDATGSVHVTGTAGPDHPTTPDAIDATHNGGADVFVSQLSPGGSGLIFSTFLGGSSADWGKGIALDAAGGVYVTGSTGPGPFCEPRPGAGNCVDASDFPTSPGAFDRTFNGGGFDAFVAKLSPGTTPNPFPGVRRIQNSSTGLYAEVSRGSSAEHAWIVQNPLANDDRQRWSLEPTGGGEYVLRNRRTGKVAQSASRGGSWVTQVTYTGAASQRWRIESVGPTWRIVNAGSGRCVDLFRRATMANLIVAPCSGAPTQLWNLPPA